MSQLAHSFQSGDLGASFEDSEVTVFFGQRGSDVASLEKTFPDYRFISLKQTHSNIVVHSVGEASANRENPEGDAHFTAQKHLALCIRTADCIPVLIHDRTSGLIAAVHAGWRGIENEILLKTGEALRARGTDLKSARAWIGPHIGRASFEVGNDVAARLSARFEAVRSFSPYDHVVFPHTNDEKKYVSLIAIARAQLASIGVDRERTVETDVDTFTSPLHDSFRRDREGGRRQNSFIALKGF